ncbi:MAG: hypothetical protein ACE5RG_10250, partial [Candidatus Nitrosomaritimum yanchengensis]
MRFLLVPWITLGISLLVTTAIWLIILDLDKQSQELKFIPLTDKMTTQIQANLQTHEQILLGFQGLFTASLEVTPNEFTHFFNIQKITSRFPDNQGVGFIEHIADETEKIEFYEKLEKYNLDFTIYP